MFTVIRFAYVSLKFSCFYCIEIYRLLTYIKITNTVNVQCRMNGTLHYLFMFD